MSKSEQERVALLASLGVSAKGKSLGKKDKAKQAPHRSTREADPDEIVLAPPGVDPHSMPVDDIVFDPRLLPEDADLKFSADGSKLSRKIFDLYKSPHRNPERHGALQRRITSFITAERRSRLAGHPIKEKIATTVEQRDMAVLVADSGYSAEDMAEAFRLLEEKKKEKEKS